MKKTILASVICAVTLGVTATANAAIEKDQLTIWVNGDKGYNGIAKVGEKFTADTGIKVTVAHPDQVEVKFQQTAATQNGPDIIMWAHDRFGEWAKAGLIAPVTITDEEKAKFAKVGWDAMTVDGKVVGYPVAIEAVSLLCNNKFVKGQPENFEDLMKLGDNLKKDGIKPIVWAYATPYFSYPLVAAQGGYAFKKVDGGYDVKDTGVNNAGAIAGLQFISDLITKGYMDKGADYGVMEAQFTKGKAACIINGPWGWPNYDQAKVDFSVYKLPKLGGQPAKAFVGVTGMALNSASPNKELAKEFLENYLLTDEGLEAVNNDKALGVAALNSFQQKLDKDPRIAVTKENAVNGEPMPSVPEMSKFWSSFETALKNITSGRQGVKEAADVAAKRIVSE
ncbi:MAG: maltose/maltodextrin ABC transporter substrate-binding protein MalE [Aeromonadales bacterium]|nr:maltose/maltodextrin ABC transporter substrate-binding protein MalE [Aeromonadales bacterium]